MTPMTARCAPLIALLLGVACADRDPAVATLTLPPSACLPCHAAIVRTYAATAHARTSEPATQANILGDFSAGRNVLPTRSPFVRFLMERRPDGHYQTGLDDVRNVNETRRFDITVGSGRRGQTYLFWRNSVLFELPVSYLTETNGWINSPGYPDGQVDFNRVIAPRCLECHATAFTLERTRGGLRYGDDFRLGISCEKCHGDARLHAADQRANPGRGRTGTVVNPAKLPRGRSVDVCALCHSGARQPLRPAFSYHAGDSLDRFLAPHPDTLSVLPDVHGDQVGLLRRSRCYIASAGMSCGTCHGVHAVQRDIAELSRTCLQCHQAGSHRPLAETPTAPLGHCVTCHMPVQRSSALQINMPSTQGAFSMRSHRIAIYPAAATGPTPPRSR